MTHIKGSIVAPQSQWDRIAAAVPRGLLGAFLKLLEMIKSGGMECLPPWLARRVQENVWEVCLRGPEGHYAFRIVSEAHGSRLQPINRNDGQIEMPLDMERWLVENPEGDAEWLTREQLDALSALAGMGNDDWIIPAAGLTPLN